MAYSLKIFYIKYHLCKSVHFNKIILLNIYFEFKKNAYFRLNHLILEIMEELEVYLKELKSTFDNPKLYLVNYFDGIRSQIDLECHIYDRKVGNTEQAILQEELINEVDNSQRHCLSNLENNSSNLEALEQRLKVVDLEDEEAVLNVEKELLCSVFNRRKVLFMNKGIIFFKLVNMSNNLLTRVLFGDLYIVEDEFLLYSQRLQLER